MINLPIIMCVGSSKYLCDSIGPKIGDELKKINVATFVYGNSKNNIDALNLKEYYFFIKNKHKHNKIIVIDASICFKEQFKLIFAKTNGIKSIFEKTTIGDIGILINSQTIDGNQMTECEIETTSKKVALYIRKYIDFKVQML